jgi:cell division protein FtsZ
MSEDILSSDVDAATKMITDTAAEGVEFIFGTAFKEDMQDEMTITVIAAGFDDDSAPVADAPVEESPEEEIIPIDNPLIDGFGYGAPQQQRPAQPSSSQDYDLDDIFKMLGN